MSDVDRRQHPRHSADLDGRINFFPSRILGLSSGGATVETSNWLGLDQRCTLRVAEPPIQIPARVVRCRLVRVDASHGSPVYEAGLIFDASDATPALQIRLAALLAMLARVPAEALVEAAASAAPASVAY